MIVAGDETIDASTAGSSMKRSTSSSARTTRRRLWSTASVGAGAIGDSWSASPRTSCTSTGTIIRHERSAQGTGRRRRIDGLIPSAPPPRPPNRPSTGRMRFTGRVRTLPRPASRETTKRPMHGACARAGRHPEARCGGNGAAAGCSSVDRAQGPRGRTATGLRRCRADLIGVFPSPSVSPSAPTARLPAPRTRWRSATARQGECRRGFGALRPLRRCRARCWRSPMPAAYH